MLHSVTKTIYKIIINHRNYDEGCYTIYRVEPSAVLVQYPSITLNLSNERLFSGDIFEYDPITGIKIVSSDIRVNKELPAILILDGNKTYGRHPTNKKLLYKCVPDDISIPTFLVPYEIKNMGFSKVFVNQFVTIQFANWDNKHPYGLLTQSIGPVDCCESFYEYQLCCKGLNISISKFNKATNKSLHDMGINKDNFVRDLLRVDDQIEDRTDWEVFTIDPDSSLDFDDAFSIISLENCNTLVSIYIANVPLCLDRLNLWPALTKRTSTVYLPDKKRPMLPEILSDCLCSLQANAERFAFTLDVEIDATGAIVSKRFSNSIIKAFKNFAYEERSLLRHPLYKSLKTVVTQLVVKYPYINHIGDSHDVVCYLMILMNHLSAKEMLIVNAGIFRSTIVKKSDTVEDYSSLPADVSQFIKILRSTSGTYIDLNAAANATATAANATATAANATATAANATAHDILGLDAYLHITSPIRRLVDVLNMIKLQECSGIYKLSPAALEFYDTWIKDIDYINTTMKMTRRVQNDCNLLHLCYTDPDILDKMYDGYCFDEKSLPAELYKYSIYLPELRITSIVICGKLAPYSKQQFKLFVFNNEEKMKKKIRLHLV